MSLTEKGIQKLLWMLVHCHFSAREMRIKPDVRIIFMTSIPKRLIMVIGQSGLFCPIQSVIIRVIEKIGGPQSRSPIC